MAQDKRISRASTGDKISMVKYRRQRIREIGKEKQDGVELFSRIVEDDDKFSSLYTAEQLLVPPYSFANLYRIHEESDILQTCVAAMRDNIDGFGYTLQFLGDDLQDRSKPEAVEQELTATNFFDQINESQSFAKIRKEFRKDKEILGNAAFELVRNNRGELQMMYTAPFKKIRISKTSGRLIKVSVTLMRGGKKVTLKMSKYFRKFAQISDTGKNLRWFKAYGDPRDMDYRTGEYGAVSPRFRATELWHFKEINGGEVYGLPRWIGAVLQVLGRRNGQYVNWDLFEHQGIPAMMILVSGGVLTEDSYEELEDLVRSLRGVEKFNRVGILESTVEGLGIDDKGTAKIELKNLSEFRSEDMMFDRYLSSAKDDTRHTFRLPDLYIGMSESFTHATAKAAKEVVEEQVFIPERVDFDEPVNIQIMRKELGIDLWSYKSKGPKIVGSSDRSKGVESFSKVGAFTVNHAIEQANEVLGLQMSKFSDKWADYPLPIVMELVKTGRLDGLDEIQSEPEVLEGNVQSLSSKLQQPLLPMVTEKMVNSDIFSADEKSLYALLINLQNAVDMKAIEHHHE